MHTTRGVAVVALLLSLVGVDAKCPWPQLPWDLDLMTRIEDVEKKEVHFVGEYALRESGEEQFHNDKGFTVHNMLLCKDGCKEATEFRVAISHSNVAQLQMKLYETTDGKEKLTFTSSSGDHTLDKTIFAKLQKDSKYRLEVLYVVFAQVKCPTVFLELAFQPESLVEALSSDKCPDASGLPQTPDGVKLEIGDVHPHRGFRYNTSALSPPKIVTSSKTELIGGSSFNFKLPYVEGRATRWHLKLTMRSNFIEGGALSAVLVPTQKGVKETELPDCSEVTCYHGERGHWKNTYTLDVFLAVDPMADGSSFILYLYQLAPNDGEVPHLPKVECTDYSVEIEIYLDTESDADIFMDCQGTELPEELMLPGYWDDTTGRLHVFEELLAMNSVRTTFTPPRDMLLHIATLHSTVMTSITIGKLIDGSHQGFETVLKTTKGLERQVIVPLKGEVEYAMFLDFDYSVQRYMAAVEGTKFRGAHCQTITLRMEGIENDKLPKDYCHDSDHLPNITNIQQALTDTKEFHFNNSNVDADHLKEHPYPFTYSLKAEEGRGQETIVEQEFTLETESSVEVIVGRDFTQGDVVPYLLTNLNSDGVEIAGFQLSAGHKHVKIIKATNPGGDNPEGKEPMNVADRSRVTEWMDRNKGPLVMELGKPVKVDAYRFVTNTNNMRRDPLKWTLEGSNDGESWTKLETKLPFDVPILRHHPTPWYNIKDPQEYKYYKFTPTVLREYNLFDGSVVGYSNQYDASYLWASVPKGRNKLIIASAPIVNGITVYTESRCEWFSLAIHIVPAESETLCEARELPSELVLKHYHDQRLYSTFAIGAVPRVVAFTPTKPSILHTEIRDAEVRMAVTLSADGEADVTAEDYYKNGMPWLMVALKPDIRYTLTFNSTATPEDGCKSFMLMLSVSPNDQTSDVPCQEEHLPTEDLFRRMSKFIPPFGNKIPAGVYQYTAQTLHRKLKLQFVTDMELRMKLRYDFGYQGLYIDICKCPDESYEKCYDCGNARGVVVFNGNDLRTQVLRKGYYVLKIYEASVVKQAPIHTKCVKFVFEAEVAPIRDDIHVHHDPCENTLPTSLNNVGLLDYTRTDYFHAIGQVADQEFTTFEVQKLSIVRVWTTSQNPRLLIRLMKLKGYEIDLTWPTGQRHPGLRNRFHNTKQAMGIFHLLEPGQYFLLFTGIDGCDEKVEISIFPAEELDDVSCKSEYAFPTTMLSHGHTARQRPVPDQVDGKDSGHAFMESIDFTTETYSNIDIDLYSTFETGGLTFELHRDYNGEGEYKRVESIKSLRYLHREYLNANIEPGRYRLMVRDMVRQLDNQELRKYVKCNKYGLHIRQYNNTPPTDSFLDIPADLPGALNIVVPSHGSYLRQAQEDLSVGSDDVTTAEYGLSLDTKAILRVSADLPYCPGKEVTVTLHSNTSLDGLEADEWSGPLFPELPAGVRTITFAVDKLSECPRDHDDWNTMIVTVGAMKQVLLNNLHACPDDKKEPPTGVELDKFYELHESYTAKAWAEGDDTKDVYESIVKLKVAQDMTFVFASVVSDWIATDFALELTAEDGTLPKGLLETLVFPTAKVGHTRESSIAVSGLAKGGYSLHIKLGGRAREEEVTVKDCMGYNFTLLSTPEHEKPSILAVDPLVQGMGKGYPFVVRVFLSQPLENEPKVAKAAFLVTDDGEKIYPLEGVVFHGRMLKFTFSLNNFGMRTKLQFDLSTLKNTKGELFTVADDLLEKVQYVSDSCGCDGDFCQPGSPCRCELPGRVCNRCPDEAPLDRKEGKCIPDATPTPMPSSETGKKTEAPSTPTPPITPTPETRTPDAQHTPSPTPAPTPHPTPKPGKGTSPPHSGGSNAPGPKTPEAPNKGSGGGIGAGTVFLIILLIAVFGGMGYFAYKKGYFSAATRTIGRPPVPMTVAGDEALFEDDSSDGGEPLTGGTTANETEHAEEDTTPAPAASSPPAPAKQTTQPATGSSSSPLDDIFSDGLGINMTTITPDDRRAEV